MSTRPPLPTRHANPHIPITLTSGILPPVKYQILNCQGQDILVGRMKIETPTPSGHAFILRRFDTGAVSLTTMFRAAFPNAPENEEKSELQWVKENHDLSGNNGGPHNPQVTRLAGTWVSPSLAQTIGDAYALGDLIKAVVEAAPDPKASYRRSGKAAAAGNITPSAPAVVTKNVSPSKAAAKPASRTLPTPSPTAAPNPAKRRKESSPVPAPAPIAPTPSLRRSMRTKSPAPISSATVAPLTSIPKTPKTPRTVKLARNEEVLTPQGSDETVVEEDSEIIEDGIMGSELRQQDIQEQQELIKTLKKQRNVVPTITTVSESEETEEAVEVPTKLKRMREDEEQPLKFEFKEPEVGERAIATNNRVARFQMEPRTKSFVWGIAAFAVGLSAVSLLPSLF